jgi:hypothetical protein
VEKVKNFQRNYLESEKFFSKFSYFLERENFQNLKVRIPENFSLNFRIFFLKVKKFSKSKNDLHLQLTFE